LASLFGFTASSQLGCIDFTDAPCVQGLTGLSCDDVDG
jgi:hypothetical protein